jgi:hypothetical protein
MWETTVRVEREQLVDALPEKVWELAGSPAGLSARPGWFAFGVPGVVAGTDRLCCLLVSGEGSFRPVMDISLVRSLAVDVRQEIPGQLISWQVLSTEPAGKQVFTLSVHPRSGGSAVRIAVSHVVPRYLNGIRQGYWHRHVKAWLGSLRAAAEGRAPWPQAVLPTTMQRALAASAPLRNPMEASAAVVIDGAPGAVWATLWDPVSSRLIDPERVAWSGHVPGTPTREVGEMQCFVSRAPGGRFVASVTMVTVLADGHRAVSRQLGQPYECVHVITPVPGGTRLELTARFSAHASWGGVGARQVLEAMRAEMRRSAEGYRSLIEGPRAPASDAH